MKKLLKFTLLALFIMAILGSFIFLWKKTNSKGKEQYELIEAKKDSIELKTLITGTIEPRDEVAIKPQLSGIISEILLQAGEQVKEGDIIAKIKVIPEMAQLSNAESRVRVSASRFGRMTESFRRDKELFEKEVISKDEYENQRALYEQAEEDLENAKEQLEIVKNGASKKTASANTTLIKATISGTILQIPVKVGNSVIQSNTFNDGTTIASVADMSKLIFIGYVDETEVGKIKEKTIISITIGALDEKEIKGELEYVSPKGELKNGATMFEIKASLEVPKDIFIRAGYSANAHIVLDKANNVITVEESCIVFENDSSFVYVSTGNEKEQSFERRYVETGLTNNLKIEIKSGLKENEKVRGNRL